MEKIISELQNIDWNDLTNRAFQEKTVSEEETNTLEVLARESRNHVDERLMQLAGIARLMQISAQDALQGSIGGFTIEDSVSLGFFLEEELLTLSSVNQLGENARFYLDKVKTIQGGES